MRDATILMCLCMAWCRTVPDGVAQTLGQSVDHENDSDSPCRTRATVPLQREMPASHLHSVTDPPDGPPCSTSPGFSAGIPHDREHGATRDNPHDNGSYVTWLCNIEHLRVPDAAVNASSLFKPREGRGETPERCCSEVLAWPCAGV